MQVLQSNCLSYTCTYSCQPLECSGCLWIGDIFFSFSWSYGGKFRFKWIIKFLRRLIKGTIRSSMLWGASIEISTNKVNQQPFYSSLYMPIEHTPMLADTSTVISLVAYQSTTWQLSVNYCWYIGQLSALNQSIVKWNSTTSPLSISEHPLMGYRYDSNVLMLRNPPSTGKWSIYWSLLNWHMIE